MGPAAPAFCLGMYLHDGRRPGRVRSRSISPTGMWRPTVSPEMTPARASGR